MKTYTKEQILAFLITVEQDFPIPLSQKTDLTQFAEKLAHKATIFSHIKNGEIVAMIAGYVDNLIMENTAYVSILAVRPDYRQKGIGRDLMTRFLEECKKRKVKYCHFYAVPSNHKAISLFEEIGFEAKNFPDEIRKNDLHFWKEV